MSTEKQPPESDQSTESPAESATPATPAKPAQKLSETTKKPSSIGYLDIFLVSIIMSTLTAVGMYGFFKYRGGSGAPQILVADGRQIMESKIYEITTLIGSDPKKAKTEMDEFSKKLDLTLNRYSDNGVLIINNAALMSIPKGTDITKELATEMGVKLIEGHVPIADWSKKGGDQSSQSAPSQSVAPKSSQGAQ